MRTIQTFLFIAILAFPANGIAADPVKAIVSIEAKLPSGKSNNGTGFYASGDGYILTCYHLIEGAKEIEITDSSLVSLKSSADELVVGAVSGKWDIAIIKITKKNYKTPAFLGLDGESSGNLTKKNQLHAVGNPQRIRGLQFDAKPAQDGFIQSGKLNDTDGKALFSLENVNLIPLQMTIGNGMSGAPVLKDEKAVGILSGSLVKDKGTFGTLAWAIPISYLSKENAEGFTNLSKRPEEIRKWPALELMSSNGKSLFSQPDLDPKVERQRTKARELLAKMEQLSTKMLEAPAKNQKDHDDYYADVDARINEAVQLAGKIESELIKTKFEAILPKEARRGLFSFDALASNVDHINDDVELDRRRLKSAFEGANENMITLKSTSNLLPLLAGRFLLNSKILRNSLDKAKNAFGDLLVEEMDAIQLISEARRTKR